MLNEVTTDLWETTQPLRFAGLPVGCRMTVVRLTDGSLLVHSPVRGNDELYTAVEALGTVRWLVAPNALHHLFLTDWRERFPDAELVVAPKLLTKRKDLAGAAPLTAAPADWSDQVDVLPVGGIPQVDEFAFFHRASATLIATDLAFNFDHNAPFLTRWFVRIGGRLGELAPTVTEKLLVRDKAALKASLLKILEWPFDRVVVSHGNIVESGGHAALAKGFDWLLDR